MRGHPPLTVHRHGALLALERGAGVREVAARSTLTKRGSRSAYFEFQRRMLSGEPLGVCSAEEPGTLIAARVESGRIVDEVRIPFPAGGDEPDAGVREPRRPRPFTGGAAA